MVNSNVIMTSVLLQNCGFAPVIKRQLHSWQRCFLLQGFNREQNNTSSKSLILLLQYIPAVSSSNHVTFCWLASVKTAGRLSQSDTLLQCFIEKIKLYWKKKERSEKCLEALGCCWCFWFPVLAQSAAYSLMGLPALMDAGKTGSRRKRVCRCRYS